MRLLFALELPPSMIDTLTELQRRLLGIGIGGRAIPEEGFRMLFQVGGEASEADAQDLILQLEHDLAVIPSPLLQIVGVGALVRAGGDNVYAQLGGDTDALYRLQHTIGQSIDALGLALDMKPFAPNITILHGCRFGNPKLRVRSNSFFLSHLAMYLSQPMIFHDPSPDYEKIWEKPFMR